VLTAGQLKVADGYVYLSGELFSTTMRRITVPMLAGMQPSLVERLNGAEQEAMKYLKTIEQLSAAAQGGRLDEVRLLYQQLPESLKKEKVFMLQWLTASQNASETEYLQALEAFRSQFPNDVALDFILLDYQALHEDYQGAADALRRLEASMGGDSHLHSLLAVQQMQLGQLAESRKTAEETMQMDPELDLPIQILAQISCKEERYDEVLALMKQMLETYGIEFLEMPTDPDFAGFVASPQYAEWQQYRASLN
jgi:tetratricopeptide (TPR) repeat protein